MRGLAILMVAIYHYTYRWSSSFSYGQLVDTDFLKVFIMGVQLFFIISGYVIFKTIENTNNFKTYTLKRMRRLLPALILTIPILYLFQKVVNFKDFPNLNLLDIIISIAIIHPTYVAYLFHIETNFVTGVMWTLTYEITFYAIIGVIYYFISKRNALLIFILFLNLILFLNYSYLFATDNLGNGYNNVLITFPSLEYVIKQSGLLHLSWFALGMWFYKYEGKDLDRYSGTLLLNLLFLIAYDSIGGTSVFEHKTSSVLSFLLTTCFVILFGLNHRQRYILSPRLRLLFAKLGDISYEFYLIHEVIGVVLLSLISNNKLFASNTHLSLLLILIIFCFVIFLAKLVQNLIVLITSK